ncbi:MAG: nucleotidyltransferase domain-containing protein [Clostridia bacterium]|nr:nucleotidyltransferase domain-containing protein [Clostridia bacterium]
MPNYIKKILNEFVTGLDNIIGSSLINVILYGSYARGEQNKNGEQSDIDIMILVDAPLEDIKKLQKSVLDYSFDLNLKYNILLSPIVENIEVFNHRREFMVFYKNVQKEGVLING